MKYAINEIFYSLKGEGQWTGMPMSFIRFSGCNLACAFCDTEDVHRETLDVGEIIHRIKQFPVRHVVLTGGEPLAREGMDELVYELDVAGFATHLETNGMLPSPVPRESLNWIAVSPKSYHLSIQLLDQADEIKFLCGQEMGDWESMITHVMNNYTGAVFNVVNPQCRLFLMPIAKGWRDQHYARNIGDLSIENMRMAVDYCKKHPRFSLCVQLHKVLGIP